MYIAKPERKLTVSLGMSDSPTLLTVIPFHILKHLSWSCTGVSLFMPAILPSSKLQCRWNPPLTLGMHLGFFILQYLNADFLSLQGFHMHRPKVTSILDIIFPRVLSLWQIYGLYIFLCHQFVFGLNIPQGTDQEP